MPIGIGSQSSQQWDEGKAAIGSDLAQPYTENDPTEHKKSRGISSVKIPMESILNRQKCSTHVTWVKFMLMGQFSYP